MERFMTNGEQVLTRITLEQYDKRYIVESPYSDENMLETLIDLSYSALLAAGYNQEAINNSLVSFAKEKGYKEDDDVDEGM